MTRCRDEKIGDSGTRSEAGNTYDVDLGVGGDRSELEGARA